MDVKSLQTLPIAKLEFSVVDTETTGMYAEHNRITDIGIVKVKDGKILEKWETLINPEQPIPFWITQITNITNFDVSNKPKFREIAPIVLKKLAGSIFVAHNAEFDYAFMHQEFLRSNIDWQNHKLCTVLLGRKLLPELKKANLDMLAKHYNIEITNRHRALPDAEATAKILIELIKIAQERHTSKTFFDLEKLQKIKVAEQNTNNMSLFSTNLI